MNDIFKEIVKIRSEGGRAAVVTIREHVSPQIWAMIELQSEKDGRRTALVPDCEDTTHR